MVGEVQERLLILGVTSVARDGARKKTDDLGRLEFSAYGWWWIDIWQLQAGGYDCGRTGDFSIGEMGSVGFVWVSCRRVKVTCGLGICILSVSGELVVDRNGRKGGGGGGWILQQRI
ncbi:Hypothetical predicted protein [Olea europaea subsp. europaea]|uniref:Uncharacterized protein n=1 Tax=Olea europaea subsp. europaea TaxID=158383 RepID=A0A8S0TRK9_OLEEU|nr:Hypothetical predicted protein [Olea europaea subsp. europaea]